MFGGIAGRYDLANDVLSLGIPTRWKRRLVAEGVKLWNAADRPPLVLDVATGTRDIAFEWERELPFAAVTGVDFTQEMIRLAESKAKATRSRARFLIADAQKLPFADSTFDFVSIGFGIRNVQDPVKALREFGRVLRPGGHIFVLEFGRPRNPVFAPLYKFYSENVLPRIGARVSGNRAAYEYLNSSSQAFPDREDFLALSREALPTAVGSLTPLAAGIAYLYRLSSTSVQPVTN